MQHMKDVMLDENGGDVEYFNMMVSFDSGVLPIPVESL